MFLDDKIVQMVIEQNPKNWEETKNVLNDVVELCFDKLINLLNEDKNNLRNALIATKKVCNLWDSAARQLEKKGYTFLAVGGFKKYLLSKPEFAKTFQMIGFK